MNNKLSDHGHIELEDQTLELKRQYNEDMVILEMDKAGIGLMQNQDSGKVEGAMVSLVGRRWYPGRPGMDEDGVSNIMLSNPEKSMRLALAALAFMLNNEQLDMIEEMVYKIATDNVKKGIDAVVDGMLNSEVLPQRLKDAGMVIDSEATQKNEGPAPE